MRLGTWTLEVAALLGDEAHPVTTDPRAVRVPGGIVFPETIHADRLAAAPYAVTWRIVLVSAGTTPVALDELGRLADHIDGVTGGLEWETTTISDPNLSADPLPALQATYTTDCED